MMQCIRQPKDPPILTRAMKNSEISQVRRRDVVESHMLSDHLPLAYEVEYIDVLVELGPMVNQSKVGYGQSTRRFVGERGGNIEW
jgi:hypothetical protein